MAALAFGWLGLQTSGAVYWWLGLALAILRVGFGLSTTTATTVIINAIPGDEKSTAAALNDALREVGAAIGIALLGTVLNAAYRVRVVDLGAVVDAVILDRVRDGFGPAMQVASSTRELADRIVAVARDTF